VIRLIDILKEIAYPLKKVEEQYDELEDELLSVTYKFSSKGEDYDIEFYSDAVGSFELAFGLSKNFTAALDTDQMTGEGDAANILQTVCEAVNKFFEEYDDQIEELEIVGTDEKRKRVYKAYMPKYIRPEYMDRIAIK